MGLKAGLQSLVWGSAQAGGALTVASTAWLVSGLSHQPLVNSLLPALGVLPTLLPLPRSAAAGYVLQLLGGLLLLGVSLKLTGPAVLWPLLAVLLFGLGGQMSTLPLQQSLVQVSQLSMQQLRLGSSLGQLLGNLLTGVLFPIGKAVLQYANGLLLLLPLLPTVWRSARTPTPAASSAETLKVPLQGRCVVQGLLFASLFGLLALWVRKVGAGNCFDFGMVLTAYGLGRTLGSTPLRPRLAPAGEYLLIAALLAATQVVPGWSAVLLFLPMGLLAAGTDARLAASLTHLGDEPSRWQVIERDGALGGLLGTLGIGLVAQLLGLTLALPIEVAAFAAAALLLPKRRGPLAESV